jgi:purine-binding chemotaxis protein CheW
MATTFNHEDYTDPPDLPADLESPPGGTLELAGDESGQNGSNGQEREVLEGVDSPALPDPVDFGICPEIMTPLEVPDPEPAFRAPAQDVPVGLEGPVSERLYGLPGGSGRKAANSQEYQLSGEVIELRALPDPVDLGFRSETAIPLHPRELRFVSGMPTSDTLADLEEPVSEPLSDLTGNESGWDGANGPQSQVSEELPEPPWVQAPVDLGVDPEMARPLDTFEPGPVFSAPPQDLLDDPESEAAPEVEPGLDAEGVEEWEEAAPIGPDPSAIEPAPFSAEAEAVADEPLTEPAEDSPGGQLEAQPDNGNAAATETEAVEGWYDSEDLEGLVSDIDEVMLPRQGDDLLFEAPSARKSRVQQDSCIVFLLDGTSYAIPIRNVLEMDALPRVTAVPNVPGYVRGVTNLRGDIIAVLDLRTLLGLSPAETLERARILIVRTSDAQTAALAVDEVRGTAGLALEELKQPSNPVQDKVSLVLLGLSEHQNRVLNVLDVDKLFCTPELQKFAAN